jgi:hypothetical protein
MINRSPNLTLYVIILGFLCFSVGYNFHLTQRINQLENIIHCNALMDPFDYEKIKAEILRLENVKYE